MLQSQKRFEYNADFWDMRWGMKELAEGDTVMASFPHLSKVFVRVFCSEKNGTKGGDQALGWSCLKNTRNSVH